MERTLTMVIVLLTAFQTAHQSYLTNDDSHTFTGRLNKLLSLNSGPRDVSNSYFQKTLHSDPGINIELASVKNMFHSDLSDNIFRRFKRQVNQDAEIISNDPESSHSGKSMQMTTTDDLAHENLSEQGDDQLWGEDDKNHLTDTTSEEGDREEHISSEKEDTKDSQVGEGASSFPEEGDKKPASANETTDEEEVNSDIVGSHTDENVGDNHDIMTHADEENPSHDIFTDEKADDEMLDEEVKETKLENSEDNDDETDSSNTDGYSKETVSNGEANLHDNNLSIENKDTLSNVGAAEDNVETHPYRTNEDDVDTSLFKAEADLSPKGDYKQAVDEDEGEEGSGSYEVEDDQITFSNASVITNLTTNIDVDTNEDIGEKTYEVDGDDDSEEDNTSNVEEENPMPDPTDDSSSGNDPPNNNDISKESLPVETLSSTDVIDPSVTYDPLKVMDPFGLDTPNGVMEALGLDNMFGNTEISSEGSGSGDDADPTDALETDQVFKISTERNETATEQREVIEPILNKTRLNQVNSAPMKVDDNKDDTVLIPPSTDVIVLEKDSKAINEMGVNKDKSESSTNSDEGSSSSSTGSFIVLGAIMATIVVLLGYSVIKSQRQKRALRRNPANNSDTELNEVNKTLLPGKKGHGPGSAEGEKLLSRNTDDGKNGLKGDGNHPVYQNGIHHPENMTVGVHSSNGLQTEKNGDLSEIKVEEPQKPQQETNSNKYDQTPEDLSGMEPVTISINSNVPLTNGKNGTDPRVNNVRDHQPDGIESPKTDDRGSWVYGTQPETAKIKMFIDHDSIPKTPVLIVKRGSSDMDM